MLSLLLALLPSTILAQSAPDGPVAEPDFTTTGISWDAASGSGDLILVVSGPDGFQIEQTFTQGSQPIFQAVDTNGAPLADGLYKYALTPIRYNLTKARSVGDDGRDQSESRELTQSQAKPSADLAGVSGVFTIQNGAILDPNLVEEVIQSTDQPQQNASPSSVDAPADQVFNDDLIVQGSICAGFDCVNGESFGFDTLRLKENNLRIKAQDTSNSGSFPSRDWQITFNDSSNGGANKFSIDDIDGGRTPFTIEAGAPSHSLYVDDGGRIGLGTNAPVVEVHVVDGDTPTLRLQQDGSSGFGQLTWDVAGNETNFFIRDATNGSKLPFKIFPNAPTNSLVVEGTTGDIGVGIQSPTASLHVRRTNGSAKILVEETSATGDQILGEFKHNGIPRVELTDTRVNGTSWGLGVTGAEFFIYPRATFPLTPFIFKDTGDLEISGGLVTATPGSCTSGAPCRAKSSFDIAQLLSKLASVPIVEWNKTENYSADAFTSAETVSVSRLSPDGSSFYSVYGFGKDGNTIAPLDVASVALAAAQALNEQSQAHSAQINSLQSQISSLQQENAALQSRLAAIEAALNLPTPENGASKSSIFVPSVQR
ncbi:MAG: hypothetical protein WBO46_23075 [Caldilineaceae bacterium]